MMAHGLRKIEFKRVLNVSEEVDDLFIPGKLFHSLGSETADVLSPLVFDDYFWLIPIGTE